MKKGYQLLDYFLHPEMRNLVNVLLVSYKLLTNGKVRFNITWNSHKIQSFFNNKDKIKHFSCVTYKDSCSCGADHIGETKTKY